MPSSSTFIPSLMVFIACLFSSGMVSSAIDWPRTEGGLHILLMQLHSTQCKMPLISLALALSSTFSSFNSLIWHTQLWNVRHGRMWWICVHLGWRYEKEIVSGFSCPAIYLPNKLVLILCQEFRYLIFFFCSDCSPPGTQLALLLCLSAMITICSLLHPVTLTKGEK